MWVDLWVNKLGVYPVPRIIKRLTAKTVEKTKKPGYYADGAGLYLQVSRGGSKSWIFRYMLNGRAREMGLGSVLAVTLETAREKAGVCRSLLDKDRDPIAVRAEEERQRRLETAKAKSFDECAASYIKSHRAGWKNEKHAAQWEATLKTYASPVFGSLAVGNVDTGLVVKVLEPIWTSKTETASRVRGRIESILDWAKVRGYRDDENPARWRGHLDKLLPKRSTVAAVRNHPALPYTELPGFMEKLRVRSGTAARALEFIILTAARQSEAVNATWPELDLSAKIWTVPGSRMKAKREHRVPLSDAALKILEAMNDKGQTGDFAFPGWRVKRPITGAACLKVLREMGYSELTVHGFRSTFRDWAAEQTNYPREVAEAALAHVIPDKTEAAYRRGDLFEKRAKLMQEWARYCAKPRSPNVMPIRRGTAAVVIERAAPSPTE